MNERGQLFQEVSKEEISHKLFWNSDHLNHYHPGKLATNSKFKSSYMKDIVFICMCHSILH